jgi:hypothetical protein
MPLKLLQEMRSVYVRGQGEVVMVVDGWDLPECVVVGCKRKEEKRGKRERKRIYTCLTSAELGPQTSTTTTITL